MTRTQKDVLDAIFAEQETAINPDFKVSGSYRDFYEVRLTFMITLQSLFNPRVFSLDKSNLL